MPLRAGHLFTYGLELPTLETYWSNIFKTISDILMISIQPTALLGLLGYVKKIPMGVRKLIAMLLLLAKRRIAMTWGRLRPPLLKDWITDVTFCQEQLAAFWELMQVASRPKDIWGPFVNWLQTVNIATSDLVEEAVNI